MPALMLVARAQTCYVLVRVSSWLYQVTRYGHRSTPERWLTDQPVLTMTTLLEV